MSPDIAVGIWLAVLLGPAILIWLIFLIGGDLDD